MIGEELHQQRSAIVTLSHCCSVFQAKSVLVKEFTNKEHGVSQRTRRTSTEVQRTRRTVSTEVQTRLECSIRVGNTTGNTIGSTIGVFALENTTRSTTERSNEPKLWTHSCSNQRR